MRRNAAVHAPHEPEHAPGAAAQPVAGHPGVAGSAPRAGDNGADDPAVLQDHRVDLPLAGHLLPDRGGGGVAAVPEVPGGPLPALLPVRGKGHVHVRLRPVADEAAGQGR